MMEIEAGQVCPGEQILVHINISAPKRDERFPVDICIIIDVSGSMQQVAVLNDQESSNHQLSILDIVLHAVRTTIYTMDPRDRLGIVAYSDTAKKVLDLTFMDEAGQSAAEDALRKLRADGQTNLWEGLEMGFDLLSAGERSGALPFALLFTDGVPNVEPTGGHLEALGRYRQRRGGKLPATLHTFGFGTDLDSELLDSLARDGGGLFAFIPEAGFVGTALVNCAANALTTAGRNLQLELELPSTRLTIEKVLGYSPATKYSGSSCCIHLGALQLEQTKNVVVVLSSSQGSIDFESADLLQARLVYDDAFQAVTLTSNLSVKLLTASFSPELIVQKCRLHLVDTVRELLRMGQDSEFQTAGAVIANFQNELSKLPESSDERLVLLMQDVEGQISEALSRPDWFKAWGAHYLRSLSRAHLCQQCSNFKDPGVQAYGGHLFEEVRDAADAIFLKLPPPRVEEAESSTLLLAMGFSQSEVDRALDFAYGDVDTAAQYLMDGFPAYRPPPPRTTDAVPAFQAASVIDMASFYNSAAPCFSGNSQVLLENGSLVPISMLKSGDRVATLDAHGAEVRCLLKTRIASGRAELVTLGPHVHATAWHPVFLDKRWVFPSRVACVVEKPCEAVFNVVLSNSHVFCVGGVWTVSLGHGLTGPVVEHGFWGSQKVIAVLTQMKGWSSGYITLGSNAVIRSTCGLAIGLRLQAEETP